MSTQTQQQDGLLNQRSIAGILVHPCALLTGGLAAIFIYVIARHYYTKANARNALNWYISVLVLFVIAFTTFFIGADELEVGGETIEWAILPEPLGIIVSLIGVVLVLVAMLAMFATWIFSIVATIKAIFGTAWEYPLARSFIGKSE